MKRLYTHHAMSLPVLTLLLQIRLVPHGQQYDTLVPSGDGYVILQPLLHITVTLIGQHGRAFFHLVLRRGWILTLYHQLALQEVEEIVRRVRPARLGADGCIDIIQRPTFGRGRCLCRAGGTNGSVGSGCHCC